MHRVMRDTLTLRPARPTDLPYCRALYYEAMRPTIERLFGWDQARQDTTFERQWRLDEVLILVEEGRDIGWMQAAEADGAVFLKQLYVDTAHQSLGIGTQILSGLIDRAHARNLPVTLGVVKGNPALKLYERLGFRLTGEDTHKVYLRCDPRA